MPLFARLDCTPVCTWKPTPYLYAPASKAHRFDFVIDDPVGRFLGIRGCTTHIAATGGSGVSGELGPGGIHPSGDSGSFIVRRSRGGRPLRAPRPMFASSVFSSARIFDTS